MKFLFTKKFWLESYDMDYSQNPECESVFKENNLFFILKCGISPFVLAFLILFFSDKTKGLNIMEKILYSFLISTMPMLIGLIKIIIYEIKHKNE